jgi:hypothetical protein
VVLAASSTFEFKWKSEEYISGRRKSRWGGGDQTETNKGERGDDISNTGGNRLKNIIKCKVRLKYDYR